MSSLSLVRYRTNGYSVPVAYGHRDVIVRGCVGQVVIGQAVISCGSEVIAKHPRSYERDDFVFDPIHYLPLLEQKTGTLAIGWRRSRLAFLPFCEGSGGESSKIPSIDSLGCLCARVIPEAGQPRSGI